MVSDAYHIPISRACLLNKLNVRLLYKVVKFNLINVPKELLEWIHKGYKKLELVKVHINVRRGGPAVTNIRKDLC